LNNGEWGRKEGVELTNALSKDTSTNPSNIDFGINNERQDYKVHTVKGVHMGGGVNKGDESEGIWLMSFIYIYKIKQ
jgi:hypothetical protein